MSGNSAFSTALMLRALALMLKATDNQLLKNKRANLNKS